MRLSKQRRTWLEKARRKELEQTIASAPSFIDRSENNIYDRDLDHKEAKEALEWMENL